MRLVREDVEARTNAPGDELRDERRFVDDLAPRGVDEARAVSQQRQTTRVDQAARLRRQRRMDA